MSNVGTDKQRIDFFFSLKVLEFVALQNSIITQDGV